MHVTVCARQEQKQYDGKDDIEKPEKIVRSPVFYPDFFFGLRLGNSDDGRQQYRRSISVGVPTIHAIGT